MSETPKHEQIRAMKGRGTKTDVQTLPIGTVIRVDGMKYLVIAAPERQSTGSITVPVYSEDAQMDTLFLSAHAPVAVLGSLSL